MGSARYLFFMFVLLFAHVASLSLDSSQLKWLNLFWLSAGWLFWGTQIYKLSKARWKSLLRPSQLFLCTLFLSYIAAPLLELSDFKLALNEGFRVTQLLLVSLFVFSQFESDERAILNEELSFTDSDLDQAA